MLKEFITNYILAPLVFVVLYGGILIAGIYDRMRAESKRRKYGF